MPVERPDGQSAPETAPPAEDSDGAKTKKEQSGNDKMLETTRVNFSQARSVAQAQNVENDYEYKHSSVDRSLGYVPFLENLLQEVKDKDEWTGDSADEQRKEQTVLRSAAEQTRANLEELSKALNASPDKQSEAYRKLRTLYVADSSRLTELLADVDENKENVDLRDADKAAKQTQETIKHMTTDEAIDWTQRMMSSIDDNNWQSRGLKECYGKLAMAVRQSLQMKLAEEKQALLQDPSKAGTYAEHCMTLAKLFTDRGTPIDGDLTDIDFAVSMAKEAMGFEELALRYAEKSLGETCPIRAAIASKKEDVLHQLQTKLPPEQLQHPQVQAMVRTMEGNPQTIQGLAEQYSLVRTLEVQLIGNTAPDIQEELNEKLAKPLEAATEKFETFLNGTWKGAASFDNFQAAIGEPSLTSQQTEAWKLLSDIQGYGWDIGDKTWSTIGAGAKIAAMIVAGAAIGALTAGVGLGVIAAAVAGGAAMTGMNAAMNQQGFDNVSDALDSYGKDMAVNTTTMGAARYLAAGRAAYQLSRAGLLKEAGGVKELFRIASQKGGLKIINSFDDGLNIGTRLTGATLEGSADTLIGTTLDTAVQGGEFLDNLKNNAMFMGLGYAEFAGPAVRRLRNLPPEELHGIQQTVSRANLLKTNLEGLCVGTSIDPRTLLESTNLDDQLKGLAPEKAQLIREACEGLQHEKELFVQTLETLKREAAPSKPTDDQDHAETKDVSTLKDHLKTNDVDDTTRLSLAEQILSRPLTEAQKTTVLEAHRLPGVIDALSPAELRAKAEKLKSAGFTDEERRMLIEAGICGAPPPPPPLRKRLDNAQNQMDIRNAKVREVRLKGNPGRWLFVQANPDGTVQVARPGFSEIRTVKANTLEEPPYTLPRVQSKPTVTTPETSQTGNAGPKAPPTMRDAVPIQNVTYRGEPYTLAQELADGRCVIWRTGVDRKPEQRVVPKEQLQRSPPTASPAPTPKDWLGKSNLTVRRSDGTMQGGWTVEGTSARGNLILSKTEGGRQIGKEVTAEDLNTWNRPAQSPVTTRLQTAPPPPPRKVKPSPGSPEVIARSDVQRSMESCSLMEDIAHRSFADVRRDLASADYASMFTSTEGYEQKVSALEAEYRRQNPGLKEPSFASGKQYAEFVRGVVESDLPRLHGQRVPTQDSRGIHLWYGSSRLDGSKPITAIYINPRNERFHEVLGKIDGALARENAQVKVNLDCDALTPDARTDNKLVVYFSQADSAGIGRFLTALHGDPQLPLFLKPQELKNDVSKFKIPLAPGMSLVERPDEYSWDSKYIQTLFGVENANFADQLFNKFKNGSMTPKERKWGWPRRFLLLDFLPCASSGASSQQNRRRIS
ncbi:MAG: hypothetical protein PHW10_01130 [Candidatus Peribacteraceae bacterium]|nr:hypothetical protein [Candidatus Peribacteraceae bacterium]